MLKVLGHTMHKERLGQQGLFGRVKRGYLRAAHYYIKDGCEEGRAKLLSVLGCNEGQWLNPQFGGSGWTAGKIPPEDVGEHRLSRQVEESPGLDDFRTRPDKAAVNPT